jgi:hypothetical protein
MKVSSLIIGIFSILGMLLSLIPFLGALNWINIVLATLGLILGILGMKSTKVGQTKGTGIAGIVLCSIAIIVGIIRLNAGGGII